MKNISIRATPADSIAANCSERSQVCIRAFQEMIPDMTLSSSLYSTGGSLTPSVSNSFLPSATALAQHVSGSSTRLASSPTTLCMTAASDIPGRLATIMSRPLSDALSSAGGASTTPAGGVSTSLSLLLRGGALRGGGGTPKLDLDRVAFRLEGMEIYSLVMALFMGAALTLLGATPIKIHPWTEMKKSRSKFAETIASCCFYAFCTYAVISSGFTTILFTLTSLYCKTAVGMGADDRYLAFLDATGMIRFFGFNAFMRSITTFCISVRSRSCNTVSFDLLQIFLSNPHQTFLFLLIMRYSLSFLHSLIAMDGCDGLSPGCLPLRRMFTGASFRP